ncbi:energy transducer TonB [Sphingomonas sp.]|uniref:energy transducer TonB n=1 Tax=Sphingomonas sp. TaxID=28214 RepID=UPI0025DB4B48|nr:energy transducer TonB [Sphingomonas sp.]
MPGYHSEPTRPDKAKAIAGVVAVYAVVIGAGLLIPKNSPFRIAEQAPTVLIDINELPKPQPLPQEKTAKAKEDEGAAGKKAEPTEIVAPQPRLPAITPVAAAPVAGAGTAPSAGAANAGIGPGAGGSGTGRGGGGSAAQWISGGLENGDYPREALRNRLQGRVSVRFTVLVSGRIANCRITASSGSPLLDATTCRILTERLRFSPATNNAGAPIQSELGSDYTWGINFRRY